MEEDRKKMQEFLGKLWMNPSLQKTPLNRKENQVLSFLKENQSQLQQVFSRDEYFPHLDWNETLKLLVSELVEKLIQTISTDIETLNREALLPAIFDSFGTKNIISEENFKNFVQDQFRAKAQRDQMLSSIQMISLNYFNNYVPEILTRRKFIFNEIYRRDRLKMDIHLIPKYLNLTALFRPLFYAPIPYRNGSDETMSLAQAVKDRRLYDTVMNKMGDFIQDNLGQVPEHIYRSGIESNLNHDDFPDTTGAAKLIGVIAARSADFVPMEKQDRGADTPDKSWFQINRRNAKVYGIDPDIIDELYQIAGDRGW